MHIYIIYTHEYGKTCKVSQICHVSGRLDFDFCSKVGRSGYIVKLVVGGCYKRENSDAPMAGNVGGIQLAVGFICTCTISC